MKNVALAAALALALQGCAGIPVTAIALGIGSAVTTYCTVTSKAGKEAIRDVMTAGQKILSCQEPAE